MHLSTKNGSVFGESVQGQSFSFASAIFYFWYKVQLDMLIYYGQLKTIDHVKVAEINDYFSNFIFAAIQL